jgi:uncharacterized protein (DUF1499 family)
MAEDIIQAPNQRRNQWIVIGIVLLLVVAVGYPLALAGVTLASPLPPNVGNGELADCPATPNCVSSLATDPGTYVAPFPFQADADIAQQALIAALEQLPRTTLIQVEDDYVHAETRSAIMRFVDDNEFVIDPASGVIQIRAAARLGQSDMGVNRSRVEQLRTLFERELARITR